MKTKPSTPPGHVEPPAPPAQPGAHLIVVASGKGGIGKTTLATATADLLTLNGQPFRAFQVDDQRRLSALLGARVGTIVPDFEAAMRTPRALTSPFALLYNACADAQLSGTSVLLDVGANRGELVAMWARMAELSEDLVLWGIPAVILVPAVVEAEALRQAADTVRMFAEALPEATIAFVENQRDGRLADLKPRSESAMVWRELLQPMLAAPGRCHLVMPLIGADAWSAYENHSLRFIKAMSMQPIEAATLLGEEVSDAKIMRSAVTAFMRAMRLELARVLPTVSAQEPG